MRHGWTVCRTLIVFGLGLGGFAAHVNGGEPTDDRLGIRTAPLLLLTRADVQKDLGLSPKQGEQCKHAALSFYDRAVRLRGRKDAGARAARKAIDQQTSTWLSKFLTEEQLGRLEQIDLQWEGASAMLSRPYLDESLKLTAEQKKKVAECIAQGNAQRVREGWSYENHVNQTRMAIAFLDTRQQNLWVRVLGPKCPFHVDGEPQAAHGEPTTPK